MKNSLRKHKQQLLDRQTMTMMTARGNQSSNASEAMRGPGGSCPPFLDVTRELITYVSGLVGLQLQRIGRGGGFGVFISAAEEAVLCRGAPSGVCQASYASMLGLLCLKTRTGQGALCVRYSETLPRPRKDVTALRRVKGTKSVSDSIEAAAAAASRSGGERGRVEADRHRRGRMSLTSSRGRGRDFRRRACCCGCSSRSAGATPQRPTRRPPAAGTCTTRAPWGSAAPRTGMVRRLMGMSSSRAGT